MCSVNYFSVSVPNVIPGVQFSFWKLKFLQLIFLPSLENISASFTFIIFSVEFGSERKPRVAVFILETEISAINLFAKLREYFRIPQPPGKEHN